MYDAHCTIYLVQLTPYCTTYSVRVSVLIDRCGQIHTRIHTHTHTHTHINTINQLTNYIVGGYVYVYESMCKACWSSWWIWLNTHTHTNKNIQYSKWIASYVCVCICEPRLYVLRLLMMMDLVAHTHRQILLGTILYIY